MAAVGTVLVFAPSIGSLFPVCAILEVAVHKGFKALDTVAHVLTAPISGPG
jgi:hypothetical protein